MTGNEILTTFEEFVSDSLGQSITLALANQARTELDIELRPQCAKKLDTSQSVASGNTYTTSYSLQSDVLVPAGHTIYVGSEPFTGVEFEHRELYKNQTGFWYVDLRNATFHLTGSPTAGLTITFPYISSGTDIAADDNTVLKYPSGTHIIIPMHMARIWYAIDQGEKPRSWLPEWETFYQKTKRSIIDWDHQWKLASIGGSTPMRETERSGENRINF